MTINLFGGQAVFGMGDEELDADAEQLDIPIHAFDVIVADECHRGYTSSEAAIWRRVLDHFDPIKIGLTATPASHTTSYFRDIVYRYEYERAVREGRSYESAEELLARVSNEDHAGRRRGHGRS